jgi:ribosomal protein L32
MLRVLVNHPSRPQKYFFLQAVVSRDLLFTICDKQLRILNNMSCCGFHTSASCWAVPKKRVSYSRKRKKWQHNYYLKPIYHTNVCLHCGEQGISYNICQHCGWYGGKDNLRPVTLRAQRLEAQRKKEEQEKQQQQQQSITRK